MYLAMDIAEMKEMQRPLVSNIYQLINDQSSNTY